MQTREVLKHKIDTAQDLQAIVKMMKALAAVSIRQYEKAIQSLTDYNRTLELALQAMLQSAVLQGTLSTQPLLSLSPTQSSLQASRLAVVIFGSDQGMCGRFNDTLSQFTLNQLPSIAIPSTPPFVLVVGQRLGDRWQTLGQPLANCFSVPSSVDGITPLVQTLVLELEAWRTGSGLTQGDPLQPILVFHNRCLSSSTYTPYFFQLFPFQVSWIKQLQQQTWQSRCLPLIMTGSDQTPLQVGQQLFSELFRQIFFVSIYRACAESLASEHASRLAAMQVAEKNIAERLTALQFEFQQQRQTTITEELLDIVAGFEALGKPSS